MSNKNVTFDFSLLKEQISELYEVFLKKESSVLGILLQNGRGFAPATNTKYEWLESQLTPSSWTVNGAVNSGTLDPSTPASITFDSTAGMNVGDIIRFEVGTTGAPVGNLQIRVTEVTSGTAAKAVIYGGTTDATIPDNAVAQFISSPKPENEKSFTGENEFEPSKEYNFTQIFRRTVELSDTALNSLMYGDTNTLEMQLQEAFYKMRAQMAEQVIFGRRVQRASGVNGTFGGIEQFINAVSGNVKDASGASISSGLLNDVIQLVKEDGGMVDTIMCNINQARKISAFNTSGNNPIITRDETTTGSYVMKFVSDIPVAGGLVNQIIVDERVPKDRVYLLSLGRLALVPYANRGLNIVDATANGQDGQTAVLRGEYTMVCKDSKYSHGVLTNLAL